MLHPPILFVGDRPNPRRNLHLSVPFVGTPSYKRLLEWIYRLDLDINYVRTINAYDVNGRDLDWSGLDLRQFKIIALGEAAAERLKKIRPEIQYFQLPHPSGLNRIINDDRQISEYLSKCRHFVFTNLPST